MRSRWTVVLTAFAMLVSMPAFAASDTDTQEQLQAMQDRLQQMEDRLQATSDQLDAANQRVDEQTQLIQRSGIVDARGATSGIGGFLDTLEVDGWVDGTWFWNFHNPSGDSLGNANHGGDNTPNQFVDPNFPPGPNTAGSVFSAYPLHPDANSMSIDQVWFALTRPVSEEHRAGFHTDFVYGKTAALLNGNANGLSGTSNEFAMHTAYIEYLAPWANGIDFKFGKQETLIGVEVVETLSPWNFNITRGNVWNLMEPITNMGLLVSSGFGEGGTITAGVVNETRSFPARDVDLNNNKAVTWLVGYDWEKFGISTSGIWGSADSGQQAFAGSDAQITPAGDKEQIYNLLLKFMPTEKFKAYINADYLISDNSNGLCGNTMGSCTTGLLTGQVQGYGVSVAGRYAVTDRVGLALRGEWANLAYDRFQNYNDTLRIYGFTGTVDFKVTDNLLVRAEGRYDQGSSGTSPDFNNVFFGNGGGTDVNQSGQVTGGVEVVYSFNPLAM
jgi:Putative beta-barrel porin-2, OmpL-like. bbp2